MADQSGTEVQANEGLRAFVAANQRAIISEWERVLRQERPGSEVSRPQLLDDMPKILAELANQLGDTGLPDGPELGALPEAHAVERLELGFDLASVAREYATLREIIIQLYSGQPSFQFRVKEFLDLARAVDGAVRTAIEKYVQSRQRTLAALDRISVAALEGEALEPFLQKLLRILVETVAPLDMAMIFLLDGERLRPRAQVGLDLDVNAGFSLALGEGFAGKVANERRSLALRAAAHSSIVRSPAIRKLGTRALFGIPLLERGALIGVAYMGSTTAFEFALEDQLLFRAAADRAAGLVGRAQVLLRERALSAQLDAVLNATPAGIALLDSNLRYLRCNQALAEQNGTTVKATLGKTVAEVIPGLAPRLRPIFDEILRTGRAVTDLELTGRRGREDGRSGTWLASYYPVPLEDGRTGIGAVVMDITERRRLGGALEVSEARFKGGIMAALDCVVVIDAESRVVEWNPAAEETFGFSRAQAVGRLLPELIIPPELREAHLRGLHRYLKTAAGKFIGRRVEVEAVRADGSRFPVELAITDVQAQGARIFMGFLRDISDRRNNEREREQLIGVLSHDLRSPLTAIAATAEIVRRKAETEELRGAAGRISSSAARMGRMIFDLLDVTRSPLGSGLPVTREPADLAALAKVVVEEARASHAGQEIRLCTEGEATANLDGDRIVQAINNLLANALTYAEPDTPVEVRVRGQPAEVVVAVTNHGPPIPAELIPNLWEPFRRGAAEGRATRSSGLGLGLYIVRQIVRAHEGEAQVSSANGETSFTLRLPRRSRAPASDA